MDNISGPANAEMNLDEKLMSHSSPESDTSSSSGESSDSSDESVSETSQSDSDSNSTEDSEASNNSEKEDRLIAKECEIQRSKINDISENINNNNYDINSKNPDAETYSNRSNNKSKQFDTKPHLKELFENFPDVLRRSSRCRKEPDRFQVEAYESDDTDLPKQSRRHRKRKDSEEWHSPNNEDEEEEEEEENDDIVDDDSECFEPHFRHSNRRRLRPKARTKMNNSRNRSLRTFGKPNKIQSRYYSSSETDLENDDDTFVKRQTNRKKVSRRSVNPVSYKEESDHTDFEDLLADTSETQTSTVQASLECMEDEGEMIEKVLEHRFGRPGATGPKTASYQIEEHGDENLNLKDGDPTEIQFLIKWKGWSYLHCTWESKQSLEEQKAMGVKKIEQYLKRIEEIKLWKESASPEDIDYYEGQEELHYQLRQQHSNVERIIAHQPSKTIGAETCPEYLCKWEGLVYSECTWEDGTLINKIFNSKVCEYFQREKSQNIPTKYCRVLKQRPKFMPMKNQPLFIGGKDQLKLRDYQLDGLNWLAQSWCRDNSVILADEMGLGKTIQTISFLNYLYNQHLLFGPFLVVVPLSTINAWQKEFDNWAPSMNVVVYTGDATSRHMIREHEWSRDNSDQIKFNVLLTTYDIVLREKEFLKNLPWAVLCVDEAHRLKNDESILYKYLFSFDTNYRLLITGTPLQNSLRELWALLHFIMPQRFENWENFESEHSDSYQKGFSKLHTFLPQFLLRRAKKDVEKSLPAKVEQILRVEMTSVQKQFYKWILTKNYKALSKGVKGSMTSFTNIVMELKKCCNHASLVRPYDDDFPTLDQLQRLIRGSGKLLLLDKLLCRLKETGHRVLIFSQMVRMLDLLGEYLSLRRFSYQRLDGSIRGEFRKQALEHFNAEGSQDFCFLLSTRAGGLGINLATADTVIIFDSDWNPQNDLQAQARAHRIGQKNQVNIYRLVTKGSVEENIIERAKNKMVLDHLVIKRMDSSGHAAIRNTMNLHNNENKIFNKDDLGAIIKFGSVHLFKETDTKNGDEEPQCDIDEILKRAETREDEVPQTLGSELLSSFKMASFNFKEEDVQVASVDEEKEWSEIIPESERLKFEHDEREREEMEMMMLPRSRNKSKISGNQSDSGDDYDPDVKNADSPVSDDSDLERPKRRGRPKSLYKKLIKGFSEQEVRRFIKSYKKFPMPLNRLESIAIDAELQEKPLPDLQSLATELEQNCKIVMNELEKEQSNSDITTKKNNRGPSFKLGGVTVFAKSILSNQKELEPLAIMLPNNSDERKRWMLTGIKVKSANWNCSWSIDNDSRLLAGVYEYGFGSWEAIKMDPSYNLTDKILLDGELKPQAKQLQSRVEYLLKVMHKHLASQHKLIDETSTMQQATSKSIKEKRKKNKETESVSNIRVKKKNFNHLENDDKLIKEKHKHKKRKEKKRDKRKALLDKCTNRSDNCQSSVDELTIDVFNECREKMRAVKKALKALNTIEEQQPKLSKSDRRNIFYEHVATIGNHIDACLQVYQKDSAKMKEWRNNLWTFVSKFTEFPAKKLYKFYRRVKLKSQNEKSIEEQSLGQNNQRIAQASSSSHQQVLEDELRNSHLNYNRNNNNSSHHSHQYRKGENRYANDHYYGSSVTKYSKHSHYRNSDYGREYRSSYHNTSASGNYYPGSWSASSKYEGLSRANNYDANRYKNYFKRSDHRTQNDRYDRRVCFNANRTGTEYKLSSRNQMPSHGLYGQNAVQQLNNEISMQTSHIKNWTGSSSTTNTALLPTPIMMNNTSNNQNHVHTHTHTHTHTYHRSSSSPVLGSNNNT